ncbi:unnamed protein product [Coccothraustes coccothraustes]
MYEELPLENEPVPAVGMSLSQSATCGHFNKSCLKSSALALSLVIPLDFASPKGPAGRMPPPRADLQCK